ncbi:winged helix-turn-helix transcriptional regulator [Leeuwenhoekiella marinoflava]|uniref:HxlR family transcriptional regulator n=2 Tax=Leeuwenhoekiella marinoflava TaxID=988 RepID=A0A4Q0PMK8_9FLAO|nr:helix-turn-helix domain-containing protein [Leeuwenhoekiella marinoflava]RXG31697.1 HxlR family transcriptional regulator [Leeuwenhoekiella marinoflava]SHF08301.1 transcriptional regulator, HxlR family [Leeuwenhoekiella marinoflava DSM 3653]
MECEEFKPNEYKEEMMAVQDTMDVLQGKWKIKVLSSICFYDKRRFSDILNDVYGISNKMLSKELRDLEINQLITRTVLDTHPVTIHYQLTEHGKTLGTIIDNLTEWGKRHRKKIIGE